MSSELRRIVNKKKAKESLKKIYDSSDTTLVIHYSCESFFKNEDGTSPKIASISVKHLDSGSSDSFSVHHYAEKMGINPDEIVERYEEIEKALLDDFFKFVSDHVSYTWAHWNMKNINYGFQALEHRYAVLGGEPRVIPDSRKVDISALLKTIYGVDYATKPVLVNLCKMNGLVSEFFLPGAEEAEAFERGEFRRLHQSTLKKVDFISYVGEMALDGRLKSNSSWIKVNGIHPRIIVDWIRENWIFGLVVVLLIVVGFIRLVGQWMGVIG